MTMQPPFSLTPLDALAALLSSQPPVMLDARRRQAIQDDPWIAPQSRFLEPETDLSALPDLSAGAIIICAHGHNRSQMLAARLRAQGLKASIVAGGHDNWQQQDLPRARCVFGPVALGREPTTWVTRRRPKIDRVACPWLISRFLDPQARYLFAETDQVLAIAEAANGQAFDTPGAQFEHDGAYCTFDVLLRETGLIDWPPLARLAKIIRAADTDNLAIEETGAGLLAISLGLSQRHGDDDHAMIAEGFGLYDNLLAWIMHASGETHSWVKRGA